MSSSIRVVEQFPYNASVVFGLKVDAAEAFPLVVGCSIRTLRGVVVDIPARWVDAPGLVTWTLKAPHETRRSDFREDGWAGEVMFALWQGTDFSKRLSDTGWRPWVADWLVGASSAGLNISDAELRKYRELTREV